MGQYDRLRQEHPEIAAQNLQIVRDEMAAASPERRTEAIRDDTRWGMPDMANPARGGLAVGFGGIGGEHGNPFMNQGDLSPGRLHELGKAISNSPRPCHPSVGVASLIHCSGSSSYPSGHTAKGTGAMVLASYIFPERYQSWLNRGQDYGESRLIVGVHYPLDVMASRSMTYKATADLLAAQAGDPNSWLNRALAGERNWQRANLGANATIADLARSRTDRFSVDTQADYARNKAYYAYTKNYGFPTIGATDVPMVVPENAEYLIRTRYPYLEVAELREVLRTTADPSGAVLDDPWSRLNLFNAAEGYGAFAQDVTITMDAALAADDMLAGAGFNAADRWRNDIGGAGHLTKAGSGTLTLMGENSFGGFTLDGGRLVLTGANNLAGTSRASGGALVVDGGTLATGGDFVVSEAGTLTLRSASLSAGGKLDVAGTVDLAGSAAITVGGNGSGTLSGAVGGMGGILKNGDGRLTLGAANDFAGGVHVAAGTLALGTSTSAGTGEIRLGDRATLSYADGIDVANRLLLDGFASLEVLAGRATQSGAIGGSGTFAITGAGRLAITGDLSGFSGRTQISGSTVTSDRALGGTVAVADGGVFIANGPATATVEVGSGGRLKGSGSVGATTIDAGGTLAPGNSPGTLRVLGDITFAAGSTYEVEVDPATGLSDLVDATGRAFIRGGSVRHVGMSGTYQPFSTYRILSAAGGVDGRFASVTSDYTFLIPELAYRPNAIELTLLRNDVSFGSIARSAGQAAVAGALDGAGAQAVAYRQLVTLDAAEARAAFDTMAGDLHSSLAGSLLEGSATLRDAVGKRLRLGAGAGDGSITARGYGASPGETVDAPIVGWGHVFGDFASRSGNDAQIDTSTGGFVVGLDAALGEASRIGLFTGYSHSDFDAGDRFASAKGDSYHLGLYGATALGGLELSAGTAYSWHSIESYRQVIVGNQLAESLAADYDAGTFQAFGEVAAPFEFPVASISPFVNVAYVSTRIDGFQENGGTTALRFPDQGVDATFGTLGLRASRDIAFGSAEAVVNGTLGWRHAFDGRDAELTRSFATGNGFDIAGAPIAGDALVVGAGIDFAVAPQTRLGLSYDGQFGRDSRSNGFNGKLTIGF